MRTICGIDCSICFKKDTCKGCMATNGHTLGGDCIRAECCHGRGKEQCSECCPVSCEKRDQLIKEVNALKIKDLPEITEMYELGGCIINIELPIPNGKLVKFWNDNNIYWGMQLQKPGSKRWFGIAADDKYILISEYDKDGSNPEIVAYIRR